MPYSVDNPPRWASRKSKAVQKVAIEVFNSTLKDTGDEEKARIASLSAMKKAEQSFKKTSTKKSLIAKSLNEEKRLATFVVLEPQDDSGMTTDLHGDYYDENTILEACLEFNQSIHLRKGKLIHQIETESYTFVESYIAPADFQIGDVLIKKGTWLQTIKISENADWLWEGIKSGRFNGLSVECLGEVEKI